jgi:hypothetical protein
MKRWIGAGVLAVTLMVTGCASDGYYGRAYRYDRDNRYRDHRYRNYRDGHYRNNNDRNHDRDRRNDRDNWRYR